MAFKDTPPLFQMLDVTRIAPDPLHARQNIDEASLKGLANSIAKLGLIHPVLVQPADAGGKYTLIVGERRWRAAVLAGEKSLPALVRACESFEVLEVQVFENLGLGVRVALEPRDMANALQTIAERFASREAAAEHFGRAPTWLEQATAAANLSPKVEALLDAGRISSTGAAVQLEKLSRKNEARAEALMDEVKQSPEGEKLAKKTVDQAIAEEGGRRKKEAPAPALEDTDLPPTAPARLEIADAPRRIHPGKVQQVADILGLSADNEEEFLARLIDEFLAMKGEGNAPL